MSKATLLDTRGDCRGSARRSTQTLRKAEATDE